MEYAILYSGKWFKCDENGDNKILFADQERINRIIFNECWDVPYDTQTQPYANFAIEGNIYSIDIKVKEDQKLIPDGTYWGITLTKVAIIED